ncbi:hypothetical protein EXN66_Car013999 [Channa argus]|uniref:Uncharacterized protein n=1 Tax=Channa argus TaxID=215402 RepID=A0A6G1Q7R5_CHAAH|nr:hypothetical protein EXN66_Car013999 [Channa argus]
MQQLANLMNPHCDICPMRKRFLILYIEHKPKKTDLCCYSNSNSNSNSDWRPSATATLTVMVST